MSLNIKKKKANLTNTSPHCPKCLVRMVRQQTNYRCIKCGKRFDWQVIAMIVGYPKYGLVEI